MLRIVKKAYRGNQIRAYGDFLQFLYMIRLKLIETIVNFSNGTRLIELKVHFEIAFGRARNGYVVDAFDAFN